LTLSGSNAGRQQIVIRSRGVVRLPWSNTTSGRGERTPKKLRFSARRHVHDQLT
jgi:hypothetical protein